MIPYGRPVSLEREMFPILASQGKMNGWKHAGFWYDIGKIPDYIIANRELLKRPEYRATERSDQKMQSIEVIQPSFVGRDCILESGAKIGPNAILSERVSLGKGATIRDTIVFNQTILVHNRILPDPITR